MISAFGVEHDGVAKSWSPFTAVTKPAGKAVKTVKGKLIPVKLPGKHQAEAVTPWSRYLPGEKGGKRIAKRGPFGTVGGKVTKPVRDYGHRNIIAGTDRVNGVKARNGNHHPANWSPADTEDFARGVKQIKAGKRAMGVGLALDNHASTTGAGTLVIPTAAAAYGGVKYYQHKKRKPAGDGGPVTKSYVGGKFISASELSAKQAAKVRAGGQWAKARGVDRGDAKWLAARPKQIKRMRAAVRAEAKGKPTDKWVMPGTAGTYRVGGPSSGVSYVAGGRDLKRALKGMPKRYKKLGDFVVNHEEQHATPKRSSYRLHRQIQGNPVKMMREEARADYLAGGHYKKHPAGGSMYAGAAQVRDQHVKNGPNALYKFSRNEKRALKDYGVDVPTVTNHQVYAAEMGKIGATFPHLQMNEKKAGKAIDAYRGVHDQMRAKGAKHRQI